MEGRNDVINEAEYGPDAPFWRTSMGKSISNFGVIRPSFENPPLNEDAYRRIQELLNRACNLLERMDRVMATPIPHKEPMSALLPRLTDPWPSGYSPLSDDAPSHGLSPRDPIQTSNPTFLNPRSVSSHPIPSIAGTKPSAQVVFVPSNIGGQPLV